MECADITLDKLFMGSVVTIFSRQLKLVDYGDVHTRNHFAENREASFALIKPDVYVHTGKIIDAIHAAGFVVSKLKMGKFSSATASRFMQIQNQTNAETATFLQSDVCTGLEIVGRDALVNWQSLSQDLQKRYGTDVVRNAVHASSSIQNKKAECELWFGSENPCTAIYTNCTCVVIKPHVVAAGLTGQAIDAILEEGFEISAMQMFNLDKPTAQEFFEIYRGVLPEFIPITEHMTTGPCIVMEVRQENAVQSFRELCGPLDPEISKNLRPNSLRARFGIDRICNGFHCTDLAEDGVLESEYFFSLQQ